MVLEEGEILEMVSEEEVDDEGDVRARVMKESVLNRIQLFFPQFVEETSTLALSLVDRAYEWADRQYGVTEAREWAQGFRVPQAFVDEDVKAFVEAGNDLGEMARRARESRRSERISAGRVAATISAENPERDKLWELATEGITVLKPSEFSPSGLRGRPRLRKKLMEAGGAVERMICENFRAKGLAAVLPLHLLEELPDRGDSIHVHTLSHALKHESQKGRNVGDLGACGEGTPLNSDETKAMADEKWGRIVNIDLKHIVNMIMGFWRREKSANPDLLWEDVVLWKMDLSGAFTLLDMRPEDTPLLAAEMQNGVIAVFWCGIFGWTCMPAVFQVIPRAIQWELRQPRRLHGDMGMFVDDIIGVSTRQCVEKDMNTTRGLCQGLLGDHAIEEKKTAVGRRLTVIGWDLDLDKQLVGLAQKNALKAFYGFATEGESERVPMKAFQRWASWAERYGDLCWYMRPFRRILYGAIRLDWEHKSVRVPHKVRLVIRLYQALLALTVIKEDRFTRTLDSFVPKTPTLTIQFDGSLEGVGVTWFSRDCEGHEAVLGGTAVSLRQFKFKGKPEFQNCAEFIGVVIGVVGALENGWDTSAIWLRGDSRTAITWAESGRFRSERIIQAATVMSVIGATYNVSIGETELITSEENWLSDGQSRWNGSEEWRSLMKRVGGTNDVLREMEEVKLRNVEHLLELCDPRREWIFTEEEEFGRYWREVYEFVGRITSSS